MEARLHRLIKQYYTADGFGEEAQQLLLYTYCLLRSELLSPRTLASPDLVTTKRFQAQSWMFADDLCLNIHPAIYQVTEDGFLSE